VELIRWMLTTVKKDTHHKGSCHFDRWTLQGLVVAICTAFYLLPTQCIYVFCMDLRTNSDYFSIQR